MFIKNCVYSVNPIMKNMHYLHTCHTAIRAHKYIWASFKSGSCRKIICRWNRMSASYTLPWAAVTASSRCKANSTDVPAFYLKTPTGTAAEARDSHIFRADLFWYNVTTTTRRHRRVVGRLPEWEAASSTQRLFKLASHLYDSAFWSFQLLLSVELVKGAICNYNKSRVSNY
jgi:hypothetical protein